MAWLDHLKHLEATAGHTALTVQLGQDCPSSGFDFAAFSTGTCNAFVILSLQRELLDPAISADYARGWMDPP